MSGLSRRRIPPGSEVSAPVRSVAPPRALAALEAATAPRTLGPLDAPSVVTGAAGIAVLGEVLDRGQARALLVELAAALGEADLQARPRAWGAVRAFLDRGFAGAHRVRLQPRPRAGFADMEALAVREGSRILARLGVYQVAMLLRRRSGVWSGAVGDYFPGPMGDPLVAYSSRRVILRPRPGDPDWLLSP